jgi:hypothetical protein
VKVKLRPGTHIAPVPQGVYLSRAGQSFVLRGPAALYPLLDGQLGRLTTGTTVDELVAAVGAEAARPVFDHVVSVLLDRGMLFDVDSGGQQPPPEEARRYADVLAYLEAQHADPYLAFARLRAATVLLLEQVPAPESLVRSLAACGLRTVRSPDVASTLTVVVTGYPPATAWPDVVPPQSPVLPVFLLPAGALVGPVCARPAQYAAVTRAAERMVAWQRAEPALAAPASTGMVLAGSLASRVAFEYLVAADPPDRLATVVYGRLLESRRVALPALPADDGIVPPLTADGWTEVDPDAVLAEAEPTPPTAAEAHDRTGALTSQWTGLAGWHRDLDLPQLPMATATLDSRVAGPAGRVAGWGDNRAGAGVDAVLAFLRARCDATAPDAPGPAAAVSAAGLTPGRFLVDGLLRLAAPEVLAAVVPDKVDWADLPHRQVSALWSLLRDYFEIPAEVWLRTVPDLSWPLASVVADGAVLATQWGPGPASATQAALSAAVARVQLGAGFPALPQDEPAGTWALAAVGPAAVGRCHRELRSWLSARTRTVSAVRLVADPVAGELPFPCGRVWWS